MGTGKATGAEASSPKPISNQVDPKEGPPVSAPKLDESSDKGKADLQLDLEIRGQSQESELVVSLVEPDSSSSAGYVEDFIKSQDMTCQVVEILHQKAEFLRQMVNFELHDEE